MKIPHIYGSFLVLAGAVCWSLNSPFVKYLTLDPLLICALRSLIAACVLLPFLRPKKIHWNGWLLLYCLCYLGLCLSVIISLTMTSAAIAVGMQYTASIWLFLLATIHTKHFNSHLFLPIAVIMAGVLFFMGSGGSGDSDTEGNMIALTEGLFFAGMSIASSRAASENALGLTALGNIFIALLLFTCIPSTGAALPLMTARDWMIMIILGVVQVAGGYGLFNLGIQRISAQKASVLALWEMILGPLWVALFLGLYPNPEVLTGFGIILFGILMDSRMNRA